MDNRLKELHFPFTLDTDSWNDRARITLVSSWEQELKKNWKKLLVVAGPVGVRGRGELRVFISFGVGPMDMRGRELLIVLVAWESQKRDEVQPIRTRKKREIRTKKRNREKNKKGTFWCSQEKIREIDLGGARVC